MDIKKKSQTLKKRAKELGYEIKLTHAQEMVSAIYGHDNRHSALLEDKNASNKLIEKDNCKTNQNKIINGIYEELSGNIIKDGSIFDSSGHFICSYSLDTISNFLESEICDWDCNCQNCRDIKDLLYK